MPRAAGSLLKYTRVPSVSLNDTVITFNVQVHTIITYRHLLLWPAAASPWCDPVPDVQLLASSLASSLASRPEREQWRRAVLRSSLPAESSSAGSTHLCPLRLRSQSETAAATDRQMAGLKHHWRDAPTFLPTS